MDLFSSPVLISFVLTIFTNFLVCAFAGEAGEGILPKDDGYRGVWYSIGNFPEEFKFKYSGGLATYPQQHIPLAYYSREANKTFFCYGGSPRRTNELLMMVSYYDHATGKFPRPTILLNKKTTDAHDNPTLLLDDKGFIFIFSNSHGGARPSYIHKSKKPYSIDSFEKVMEDRFSYSQPKYIPGKGFLFLHTRYKGGRTLYWMTSRDGISWSEPSRLSQMQQGHYQTSGRQGNLVGTAFNYHPKKGGLDARTNLYYLETRDFGESWAVASGEKINPPLLKPDTKALVHDYKSEGLLVYVKGLEFDDKGHPVILFLTSKGSKPGAENAPHTWRTAAWNGERWEIDPVTTSDHNYDFGSFYIEEDGTWRIIAPTEKGPQPYGTGGEVALWISRNRGKSWNKEKQLTHNSVMNHTYVRKPENAHPDFYAFWADGHARQLSHSSLYFTDKNGDHVWRLPPYIGGDFGDAEIAW